MNCVMNKTPKGTIQASRWQNGIVVGLHNHPVVLSVEYNPSADRLELLLKDELAEKHGFVVKHMTGETDNTWEDSTNLFNDIEGADKIPKERLRELIAAEIEGKCKILPCAEGSDVFVIRLQRDNFSDELYPIICREYFTLDMLNCLGETVFLTEHEAKCKVIHMTISG